MDAASRPSGTNPFDQKPVGIMGASIGMIGTARAHIICGSLLSFLMHFQ
ncbi:MAG: hypothetical protein M1475_05295 [Actinobacteria bacterium]|nr:hypothetical protein [Actinomycetota bacterium]